MAWTDQPALWDGPYASGSETSRASAVKARDFIGPQGERVWQYVAAQGMRGATQKEARVALGIDRPSLCARFRALQLRGRLIKTAQRRGACAVYEAR